MTQANGNPDDENLAGGEWDWALRLLRQMQDEEPTIGNDPVDDDVTNPDDPTVPGDEPTTEDDVVEVPSATEDEGFYLGDEAANRLAGSLGDDVVDGIAGDDSLFGQAGDDLIDGGDGQDQLRGGGGDDILLGRGGDDIVEGGQGDDDLGGDAGNDLLTGGQGSDIFSFDLMAAGVPGLDMVTDFSRGEDLLWILGDRAGWPTLDSNDDGVLDDADLAVTVDAQGLWISPEGLQTSLTGEAAILLLGITELDAGDIILVDI